MGRDASTQRQKPNALARTVPIFDWLPNYERSWLTPDLLAGLSVWALVIPQALGYAEVIGVPPQYGRVLVGVVKDVGLTNSATLTVGAAAVGLLLLMRLVAPKLPRAFIVVIMGIVAVSWFDLTARGVDVVGKVPTGLPSIGLPTGFSVAEWLSMALGALAIILVSYSESIATATDTAAKHQQEFSPDQELIAQGAAWAGSALVGGFPGSGSLSKTAVAEGSGQKTQLAGLTVAGLTVLTLLFLAGMFSNLPQAVLGAVVIDAALGLIHFKVAGRFFATSRPDALVLVGTAIGLFFVGVVVGIILGVVVSLLLLISQTSRSPLRRMAYDPEDQVYVEADTHRMRRLHRACSSSR